MLFQKVSWVTQPNVYLTTKEREKSQAGNIFYVDSGIICLVFPTVRQLRSSTETLHETIRVGIWDENIERALHGTKWPKQVRPAANM